MRRGGFRSGIRSVDSGGEQGFWPSYADMMSTVALILFFLMLISYIQNLITGNDLQNTQEVLSDTRRQVAAAQIRLGELSDELKLKQDEINSYTIQINQQTETINAQKALISDQQSYVAAADRELRSMRAQMQSIAVLRMSILEQIRASIVDVMGDESKVSVGDNGNIILNEGVFFDLGSSSIKPESETVLNELIDVFTKFLSDAENARYVDSIVISGHTDITGTAETNRKLSTDRANSVLQYLLTGKGGKLDAYSEYFCAAGYGATRPVASNDTAEGQAANRRIEISMILKDESVLEIVEQYLAMEIPEAGGSTAAAPASPAPSALPSPSPTPRRGISG